MKNERWMRIKLMAIEIIKMMSDYLGTRTESI
jgi:hypothetical protein